MFGLDITDILINIPITLLALTVHEFSHGWVSSKLGDPTPKYQGRLTLNPMAHLDLAGTLLMIFTGFGWAKPVQVDPRYYKNTKRGMALVALAGPLSNFLLMVIGLLCWYALIVLGFYVNINESLQNALQLFIQIFIYRNAGLMVFNLIPIPPLDGSKIVGMFLPDNLYYKILQYERYCMFIIMALSLSGMLSRILLTGINFVISVVQTPLRLLFMLFF